MTTSNEQQRADSGAPIPFTSNPDIKSPQLRNLFRWIRETPNWQEQKCGVLWDFRCERCGRTIEGAKLHGPTIAKGPGFDIAQRITNQRDENPVLCTICSPFLKGSDND